MCVFVCVFVCVCACVCVCVRVCVRVRVCLQRAGQTERAGLRMIIAKERARMQKGERERNVHFVFTAHLDAGFPNFWGK